jgi:hypothetical protein
MINTLLYPLQWAVNAQIGGFSDAPKPSTHLWKGYFGPNVYSYLADESFSVQKGRTFWVSMVAVFVGPIFFLILIGVVYHLAIFVATVRNLSSLFVLLLFAVAC